MRTPLLPSVALFASVALTGLGGCSEPAVEDESSAHAALSGKHSSGPVPTSETTLQLLRPYNYVFDQGGNGGCVDWESEAGASVGGVVTNAASNFVTSLSSLETQLGIEGGLSAKIDPIAGTEGAAQITSKYTSNASHSDTKYSYLLTVKGSYDVGVTAKVKMTKQPTNPDAFLRACGDSYVRGIRYGSSVQLLMTVTAASRAKADAVAVGVTASAGQKAGVNASGTASGSVATNSAAAATSFKVDFTLVATGLNAGGLTMPTSADATTIQSATTSLGGYMDLLSKSVAADMAIDATSKNGVNQTRQAVPLFVMRGFYSDLESFDATNNPFTVLEPRLLKAASFVNKIGYLKTQLDDIYFSEIQPFLHAADQSKFNVTSGSPLPNANALRVVVARQQQIFSPSAGSGALAGNVTSGLRRILFDCLDSAHVIDGSGGTTYEACTKENASQLPEYQAALRALDAYAARSRVLPLRVTSQGDSIRPRAVAGLCREASTKAGTSLIEPTQAQMNVLAPAVAADPKTCAWFNDTKGRCSFFEDGSYVADPTQAELPRDGSQFQCVSDANLLKSCGVLCLPADGNLFGDIAPIGSGDPGLAAAGR